MNLIESHRITLGTIQPVGPHILIANPERVEVTKLMTYIHMMFIISLDTQGYYPVRMRKGVK